MKKSIRILSILMAFVMLIGSFSVMGSAYQAYKGSAIADSYDDVDKPVFTLEQYASMGLDEVDRMLAKEQLELDLFGLLYLNLTSIDATIASVEQFLETGDVLLDMLGDLKTLPEIVDPILGLRRNTVADLDIIHAVLDMVAGLRTIAAKYVKNDPNAPLDAGLLNGLIADYIFNVRELAIGVVYGLTEEGKEFDYMDVMNIDDVPDKYKGNDDGILNLGQALLNELVLGEWKMIDEELDNKCSVLMKGSYAWKDASGNDVTDQAINTTAYDYYAWVHPDDWVTVGLGGATRVTAGAAAPAADLGVCDITTDKNGYDFIEALMQRAYNHILVPVITRDTVDWVLELCGYSFDETKTQRTKWDPETQTWIDNDDYDPDYHGYIAADEDLTKIAELFNHEGLADGSIRMPKVTIPAGETLVGNFNDILGEFAELIVKKTYTRDGVTLPWTWTYGGNEHLFHNIAVLGKFVVFVTDDLFFNKRSEIPNASEIAAMDSDQQIVALVMREILNNSVDYIYIDDSYDTVVDVAYRATEQLAWQDIPQFTYTKPVRTGYATDEAYYEAVVIKMIDILFDIAVYNLNQGFDMNKANGSNPLTDTGLLQYQGDAALGSYENNLVQIAAWAFENYSAVLPFDFNSATKGAALTADQVWEDIDTVINALIPIKGDGAWINDEIAGDGTQIVSKRFIFDYILKPLYCLDATNFAKIFERNETGTFAEMNGVEIIVDLLDSVFDLLFPNVFQNLGTLDKVVENEALSKMVFDLIGTLGASNFTNSAGEPAQGRGTYIAKTALPIVCMVLGLSDDQEFEEMEIYLPEIVAANEGAPSFKIFNGSSGINTGYTDKYGNFDQDNLYKYVVRTVNVYDYNAAGSNTGALTVAGIQPGSELEGGANVDVTINGTLTPGNLIEFAITYVVMGEDGSSITGVDKNNNEITLSKTVYAYVGSTAEDDDAIEVEIKVGETGRSIKYENVMYLDSGDDLDDIEGKMIRVVDLNDDGKTTGTATVTGVTNSSTAYPFAAVNADADQITAALEGKGGTYFITPFDVAKNGVDEEGNDKYFERFEYIYAKDEDGNTLYDEETGEPIIAEDDAGNLLNNGGVVNGLYNISAAVNVAGTNVNVPVAVHLYDGYGLESAFDRAVSENRQISNYDKEAEEGAVQDHWNAYVALLKDIAKFVLKPKTSATFQADIATTNSAYENKYEEYRVALDEAIENLEKYALNTGTGALKNAYNVKSGLNYEIRYDDAGYPYRYDYKYYEDEYVFFGMRDYVPHTYNRYKDARGRVADLINSQEVFVMAPFTDIDIYGEGYEASQEELDARSASIAAYLEAKENLGVIGSIESLYAIHMIELTGDRLIALTGDTSKLEDVYEMCGNAIEAGTEGQYTVDSREAYQHAETFTEAVLADEDATPSMINTATTELIYAWKRLEKCADYSKLDAAIAAAQGTVSENGDDAQAQSNFTPDSYQALLDAYNAAVNVDRDLGASDNEYLNELATNLEDAFAALAPASAGEPTFDISTEEKFANIDWSMWYAPYLDEMGVMNLGAVVAPDGATPVDAFLILGNGVFSDADITGSFTNVENAEFVVTPNDMGNYGTGAVVQVFDAEGTLYKTYVVVVRGDVNGDAGFDSGDTDEVDMQGAYIYDWFWNSYGTNDQYKAIAGDVTGDGSIDSGDTDMLDMAAAYMGYYDMIYGGEIF